MPYNQESRHQIIFEKPEDRDGWISHVKRFISDPTIWDLIKPDIPVKPPLCFYPEEPPRLQPNATSPFDSAQIEKFKPLKLFREEDLAVFNFEDKGLRGQQVDLRDQLCQDDTSSSFFTLGSMEQSSCSQAKAEAKQLVRAEKRYHQLAKGPEKQNTESWLNEWMDMYQESVRVNLPEASGDMCGGGRRG